MEEITIYKFQKETVDAIEKNGYKHKYFNTYFKIVTW